MQMSSIETIKVNSIGHLRLQGLMGICVPQVPAWHLVPLSLTTIAVGIPQRKNDSPVRSFSFCSWTSPLLVNMATLLFCCASSGATSGNLFFYIFS